MFPAAVIHGAKLGELANINLKNLLYSSFCLLVLKTEKGDRVHYEMTHPPLAELASGGCCCCWVCVAAAPLRLLELLVLQILEMVFFRNPLLCASTASSAIETSLE